MKSESIQIKIEWQRHQTDADAFINVLIHYNAIILEVNEDLSGGARKVHLNINAMR